jgi:hypothetical protein
MATLEIDESSPRQDYHGQFVVGDKRCQAGVGDFPHGPTPKGEREESWVCLRSPVNGGLMAVAGAPGRNYQ